MDNLLRKTHSFLNVKCYLQFQEVHMLSETQSSTQPNTSYLTFHHYLLNHSLRTTHSLALSSGNHK